MKSKIIREIVGYSVVIGISIATIKGQMSTVEVVGESMHPLIEDGQSVTTMSAVHYKVGQIVIAGKNENVYIKRIYGVEGDKIRIEGNDVYINDMLVKRLEGVNNSLEYELERGEYFLLGDNPNTEYVITDTVYSRVEGVKSTNASN